MTALLPTLPLPSALARAVTYVQPLYVAGVHAHRVEVGFAVGLDAPLGNELRSALRAYLYGPAGAAALRALVDQALLEGPLTVKDRYTTAELLYAATARCACGAGLAYPLDHTDARELRAWACSRILLGEVEVVSNGVHPTQPLMLQQVDAGGDVHLGLPFWSYSVKSESQVSSGGQTTRPPGTHVEIVPRCTCRRCGHAYEGARHLPAVRHGALDCPACGAPYELPGGSLSAEIDARFATVVIEDAPAAPVPAEGGPTP